VAKKKFSQPALPLDIPRNRELMTPEARYPRGYTPDRQRAISEGLKNVHVDELRNESLFNDGDYSSASEGRKKELRAHTVSAIANSTIKPTSLNGLTSINYYPGALPGKETNVSGAYSPVSKSISIRDDMYGKKRNRAEFTLRHEIGHHVTRPMLENLPDEKSEKFFGPGLPGTADTPDKVQALHQSRVDGLKEGLADNYALKHQGKLHKKGGPARPEDAYYPTKGVKGNLGFGDESEQEWGIGYTKGHISERTKVFTDAVAKSKPEVAEALGKPKQLSLFSNNTLWGEKNEDKFRQVWGAK
jgi:hypothetical protein